MTRRGGVSDEEGWGQSRGGVGSVSDNMLCC